MCFSAKTDRAFKEFLDARNPNKQHSSTLESYLIKPVQRVLKYPLLLRELVSLTDADSEEHYHLTGKGRNIYSYQHAWGGRCKRSVHTLCYHAIMDLGLHVLGRHAISVECCSYT